MSDDRGADVAPEEADDGVPLPQQLRDAEYVAKRVGLSTGRLIELADARYVPHWRVDNGPPLFRMAEVRQWVEQNLTERCEGAPLPTYLRVISPGEPTEVDLLPKPLRSLDGIRDVSKSVITLSGIYFLCLRGEVNYVGQSINVLARLVAHSGVREFDRVFFLAWPASDLDRMEAALIRAIRPAGNFGKNGKLVVPMRDATDDHRLLEMISAAEEMRQ